MNKRLLLLVFFVMTKLYSVDSWYEEKRRGWYYFEEKSQKSEQEEGASLGKLNPKEAQEKIEHDKEKAQELLYLALAQPSAENVRAFMKQQKYLIDQSAKFASTWKSVLLSNPEMSYHLPQTDYASKLKQMKENFERKERLEEIKAEHFLIFFFSGKDLFSKEASEVTLRLAELGHWKIEAISIDGDGVEAFPNYKVDQGLAERLSVKDSPSLYLVHPKKNYVVPVAYGLLDYESIEKNIDFQIMRMKGEDYAL